MMWQRFLALLSMAASLHFKFLALCAICDALKTLEEVYGPLPANNEFVPWEERPSAGKVYRSPEYNALRSPGNCRFPLEVLILQDTTESFTDDCAEMRNVQLKEMFAALASTHPNSTFALMSFKDKPINPFGATSDYCERLEHPFGASQEAILDVYDALHPIGGLDPPEAQFQALIAAAKSSEVGWSAQGLSSKLVVLATDANPHFDLDGGNTMNLPPYNHATSGRLGELQCREEYYPNPGQVVNALERRNIYLAQLVFDGDWNNGIVRRSWEWFNTAYGQTPAFLQPLAENSSNFWSILSKVIKELESMECAVDTTPTPYATATATPALTSTVSAPLIPPTTDATMPPCECAQGSPCECPEVIIKIMHAADNLHLHVKNV